MPKPPSVARTHFPVGRRRKAQLVTTDRVRPERQFFITIGLPALYTGMREDFLLFFDNRCVYCASVESSRVSEKVSEHLHAYLEFEDAVFVDDLRAWLCIRLNAVDLGIHIDVQPCKCKKSCLMYVSKEYINLITNIKKSSLYFFYRSYKWAARTPSFCFDDPFVAKQRFCYNFLRHMHSEVKLSNVIFDKFEFVLESFAGWSLLVENWWNQCIFTYYYKGPSLYLHGKTGVCKTSYVERVIGFKNLPFVFYPGIGKFFMQGFREEFHRIILFEEFEFNYNLPHFLKRLLEGQPYAYSVKGYVSNEQSFHNLHLTDKKDDINMFAGISLPGGMVTANPTIDEQYKVFFGELLFR